MVKIECVSRVTAPGFFIERIMAYIIDVLVENRVEYRKNKHFTAADQLRNTLDENLVFAFDLPYYKQEVYYLTPAFFKFKDKHPQTHRMTNREYVEYRLAQDRAAEKQLNAWIYSNSPYRNG